MSFSPRCCSEHEFNPNPRHPQAEHAAAATGSGPWPSAAAPAAVALAHPGGGAVRAVSADPERQPAPGIQGGSSDRLAEQPRAATLPLRPMAQLAAVRPLAAGPVLFPRNQEHSLPADPVQPQGAARTAGTAGRGAGSAENHSKRKQQLALDLPLKQSECWSTPCHQAFDAAHQCCPPNSPIPHGKVFSP